MRRILFAVLIIGVLGSCGAQPTTPEGASRAGNTTGEVLSLENTGEDTVFVEEGTAGEGTTGPTTSAPVAGPGSDPGTGHGTENTSTRPAVGTNGMVSSAHPLATEAGLEILADGGNAFDAAVAMAAALGVVEPMMSGIGGYGAIVVYDAEEGEARFLNASSRVPATLDPDVFRPPTPNYLENRRSAKAVATPGNVNAWEALSEEHGELEWRRLFEPAIKYADRGFVVDERTAGFIASEFYAFPEHAKGIYGRDGVPLVAGERLVQEELAGSLRLIAERGAKTVYEGELGRAMASEAQQNGGFLTVEDLRNNRAEWREIIGIDYRGYEVLTASPPITSWGALVRLGVMSRFDPAALGHNSAAYLHAYARVTERAYWSRYEYATDPDVKPTPLGLLLSEEYWAEEAARVDPPRSASPQPSATPTSFSEEQEHTTHFVVADEEGNVVSATQTIGNVFGSRVMPEGTGIWLNDSMAYATFEPEGNALDVFPGRNRFVGICPTLVMRDGRPWAAIGTPGGHTILQTVPQMVMNLIDFDMDVQRAVSAPRISFVEPDVLTVEEGIPQPVRDELWALGHNVNVVPETPFLALGNAHALTIEYDPEGEPIRFTGGADPRGEGFAAGY